RHRPLPPLFPYTTLFRSDIVLPATMFLEHDDVYQGGGHLHILLGPKVVEAPGQCRSNHEVICALARRLGADHPGFHMTARELIEDRKSTRLNSSHVKISY